MTISDLKDRAETFDAYLAVAESIDVTSAEAVLLNIDQLLHGKTAKDEEITPGYFYYDYALYKNTSNPLAGLGTPDLRSTGDFHDGFFVSRAALKQGLFELDSFDEKTDLLTEKYSDAIFGLSAENAETYFGVYVIDHFALIVLRELNLELK